MGFFSDLWDDLTGKSGAEANAQAVRDTNAQQIELARETNEQNWKLANQNFAFQREFAEQGIQKRVEDAKKAGIHPLYAMGANTPSVSPVGAVFDTPQLNTPRPGDYQSGFNAIGSIMNVINTGLNWAQHAAQVDNIKANTALANTRTASIVDQMARDSEAATIKQNINSRGIGRAAPDKLTGPPDTHIPGGNSLKYLGDGLYSWTFIDAFGKKIHGQGSLNEFVQATEGDVSSSWESIKMMIRRAQNHMFEQVHKRNIEDIRRSRRTGKRAGDDDWVAP